MEDDAYESEKGRDTAERNEWVALMCLIAESDRDLYRQLRAEAWDGAVRSGICSKEPN